MATIQQVLGMLIPDGGYVATGDTFDGIEFIECKPITKAQFEAGFAKYDTWKAEKEKSTAEAKQALLDRLGITADEAALLLS
jgi:hypothetical protein